MADDSYYNRTELLVPMNGTNGSLIFTDYSVNPKTLGTNTVVQISTAQYKFGGSSGWFIETYTGYLTTPVIMNTSGFWCIESWIRASPTTARPKVIFGYNVTATLGSYYFGLDSTNKLSIYCNPNTYTANTVLSTNTWYHVAYVGYGSSMKIFLNGVEDGSFNAMPAFLTTGGGRIGNDATGGSSARVYYGYMQDLRITFGVSRYTSNFSVPTALLPRTQDLTCSGFLCSPELKTCNPAKLSGPSQGFLCNPSLKTYNSEDGGNYYVDGYVTVDTNPASRKVRLLSLNNGRVIQEVWSNSSGYYRFSNLKNQAYYVWCEDYQKVYEPVSNLVQNNIG